MKIEQKQLLKIIEAFIVIGIFGCLWAIGGSGDFWGGQKWIRRFLATGLFSLWAFFRSGWDWYYLLQMPLMMGASTLPYGADNIFVKWLLRFIFGGLNGASASLVNAIDKKWILFGLSVALGTAFSIILGVYNPVQSMTEQFLIGISFVLIPAMSLSMRVKK